jgi:hypothetical protein
MEGQHESVNSAKNFTISLLKGAPDGFSFLVSNGLEISIAQAIIEVQNHTEIGKELQTQFSEANIKK